MFFYQKSEKYLFFLLAISFFLSLFGLFRLAFFIEAELVPPNFLKEGSLITANLLYTLVLMVSMPLYFIWQYKKGVNTLGRLFYFYWLAILLAFLNYGAGLFYLA